MGRSDDLWDGGAAALRRCRKHWTIPIGPAEALLEALPQVPQGADLSLLSPAVAESRRTALTAIVASPGARS